jgi:hypothetical protein
MLPAAFLPNGSNVVAVYRHRWPDCRQDRLPMMWNA